MLIIPIIILVLNLRRHQFNILKVHLNHLELKHLLILDFLVGSFLLLYLNHLSIQSDQLLCGINDWVSGSLRQFWHFAYRWMKVGALWLNYSLLFSQFWSLHFCQIFLNLWNVIHALKFLYFNLFQTRLRNLRAFYVILLLI